MVAGQFSIFGAHEENNGYEFSWTGTNEANV